MASAAPMPELQENPSARLVNGTCDTAPPFDLLGQVDSRFIRKRRPAGHRHRGLSDDEARRCTLRVVLRHQRCGNMVWSAATSEWCHQDAVWRIDDPNSQWCEKSRHGSIRRCIRSKGCYLLGGLLQRRALDPLPCRTVPNWLSVCCNWNQVEPCARLLVHAAWWITSDHAHRRGKKQHHWPERLSSTFGERLAAIGCSIERG